MPKSETGVGSIFLDWVMYPPLSFASNLKTEVLYNLDFNMI
jgi:hypothetical protein